MGTVKGYIKEIFPSIQGEGIYVGVNQIFVRFGGCNLRCKFCDTIQCLNTSKSSKLSVEDVMDEVNDCAEVKDASYHSLSVTGGEPLVQFEFLKQLTSYLRKKHWKIYLDTNGTLYKELEYVINNIDYVAMDIKLPSSTCQAAKWDEHEKFLNICKKKEIFVKAVVTEKTDVDDIKNALSLVSKINKNIPFVIQPVTYVNGCHAPSLGQMIYWKNILKNELKTVQIVPQMHKIMKMK